MRRPVTVSGCLRWLRLVALGVAVSADVALVSIAGRDGLVRRLDASSGGVRLQPGRLVRRAEVLERGHFVEPLQQKQLRLFAQQHHDARLEQRQQEQLELRADDRTTPSWYAPIMGTRHNGAQLVERASQRASGTMTDDWWSLKTLTDDWWSHKTLSVDDMPSVPHTDQANAAQDIVAVEPSTGLAVNFTEGNWAKPCVSPLWSENDPVCLNARGVDTTTQNDEGVNDTIWFVPSGEVCEIRCSAGTRFQYPTTVQLRCNNVLLEDLPPKLTCACCQTWVYLLIGSASINIALSTAAALIGYKKYKQAHNAAPESAHPETPAPAEEAPAEEAPAEEAPAEEGHSEEAGRPTSGEAESRRAPNEQGGAT